MPNDQIDRATLLAMTTTIVVAHVSNNPIPTTDLPTTIEAVFDRLADLSALKEPPTEELKPAISIKKSVTDDYLICLEDGKKMKMLKRHLATAYDMTPEEYRARWGLPYDYPMVAPSYARKRQELAKQIGLGRKQGPKAKKKSRKK